MRLFNDKVMNDEAFLTESSKLLDSFKLWNRLSFFKNHQRCDSLSHILNAMLAAELQSDSNFISSIDSVHFQDKSRQDEFEKYRNELINIITLKIRNYNRLNASLDKSNFYVRTIQILLNENPISWASTIFICFVFWGPIYLKFSIRNLSGFYEEKSRLEHRIVLDNYNDFKTLYGSVLDSKIAEYNHKAWQSLMRQISGLTKVDLEKYHHLSNQVKKDLHEDPIIKYEYWADPPFRTKRKPGSTKFSSENELLKKIYPDNI